MFTYLNPKVRKKLISEGKLIKITASGKVLNEHSHNQGERVINILGPIPLPLSLNGNHYQCDWYAAVRSTELEKVQNLADSMRDSGRQNLFSTMVSPMAVNSILVIGNGLKSENPLIRVHSNCLTGDVFGSQRCECGPQFASALDRISNDPQGGIIIYMTGHEGRGIGLWAKAATYLLQDAGENTYQANESLGLPADSRDFSDAASLIYHFIGNKTFRILTNNPKKIEDLEKTGLSKMTIEKHVTGVTKWNKQYLRAKRDWGHSIGESDI